MALSALVFACEESATSPLPQTEVIVAETNDATDAMSEVGEDIVATGRALAANDVSVLFPLQLGADQDVYLRPSSPGRGGEILRRAEFDRIGRSLSNFTPEEAQYDGLRALAIRFDACFRVRLDTACQPQIRLIFQIFKEGGEAQDGAVHALYNVPLDELTTLTQELRMLAMLAPENADDPVVDVSPALRASGLDGPYARALRALVSRYVGPDTLARMTFMTRTTARSGTWEFGGFHIGDWPATAFPAPGPISIEAAEATMLQVVTRRVTPGFEYMVTPEFADAVGRRGTNSMNLEALPVNERAAVHVWSLDQQSPDVHTPDTTDCASCHLAGHVATFLEANYPTLVTPDLIAARGQRAVGSAETEGDNLRAFGYFGMSPVITQRVANETRGAVAEFAALP